MIEVAMSHSKFENALYTRSQEKSSLLNQKNQIFFRQGNGVVSIPGNHQLTEHEKMPPLTKRHVEREMQDAGTLEKDTLISLINSPLYYLDWAFITTSSDRYRLVVSQCERIITDRYFESLEGAKVGFLKIFQYLAFSEYQPAWSHPYTPYKKWLQDILKKLAIRYYN